MSGTGRRRVAPPARPGATSAAVVMALGFGGLGWLLAAPLTPLLLGHEHHDPDGVHYRHVDGSEGTILALASAAVLAAVAWAITLAVTLPASARPRSAAPRGPGARWVAAVPAVLFLSTQVPASDTSGALPLVLGTAVHVVLGVAALALARGCTETLAQRFVVPRLGPHARTRGRGLPIAVPAALLPRLARSGRSCRAPPLLPAL